MQVARKLLAFTAAAVTLTAGAFITATPANAASAWPSEWGPEPAEWGVVAIEVNPSSKLVTPMASKDVGGGTWTYGTELVKDGKRCYSQYFHGSKGHAARAKIANGSDYDHANAGVTAKASSTAGAAYTCYTYWSKD